MGTWVELVDVSTSQTLTNKTLTTAVLGSSTATTQSQGDNSTKVATTAYVDTAAAAGDTTLTNGKIWIGNGSDAKAEVTLSGDVTVSNSGVTAIGSGKVSLAKIKNQAANTVLVRDANDAGVLSAKEVANTQILIGDGTGFTAAALSGDATMTNAGAVTVTGASGNFTVGGNLTVSGTHITTSTETLAIADNTLILNSDLSTATDVDAGIVVERGSGVENATFYWDEGDDRWRVGTNDDADLSTSPTYVADVMQVRIDGAVPGSAEEVPVGHLQYHSGALYVRTA